MTDMAALADAFRKLAAQVGRLNERLTALEEHIAARGPKVVKQDLNTPGGARWEEPYRPPTRGWL